MKYLGWLYWKRDVNHTTDLSGSVLCAGLLNSWRKSPNAANLKSCKYNPLLCIQFAFQSRTGQNNKLIQFGNIYHPSPLLLYQNSSWIIFTPSPPPFFFKLGNIFLHIWITTKFALLHHTQFATYNNQGIACKVHMPAAVWLQAQKS